MATFEANDTVLGVNASALDVNAAGTQMAELKALFDVPEFETGDANNTKADLWKNLTEKAGDVNAAKASLDDSKSAVDSAKNALLAADAAASNYGDLVAAYNSAVASYNDILATYNNKVAAYNSAADGFVDAYNTWCEAQSGKYNEEQKKVITPLQALETARGAADGAPSINNVNPSTILNDNAEAISDFETKVKKMYLNMSWISEDEIDDIFEELYQSKIDALNACIGSEGANGAAGTGVLGAWKELGDAASALNEKAKLLNTANDAVDAAASNQNLTENEFNTLKKNYNDAADAYNAAVKSYMDAKGKYDSAISTYNSAREAVIDFESSVFDNAVTIVDMETDIDFDKGAFEESVQILGLAKDASAQSITDILTKDDRVTNPYTDVTRYDLLDSIQTLKDGLSNKVTVDGKDCTVLELKSKMLDAVKVNDFATYNKLAQAFNGFVSEYNKAKDTFNSALDNYIGELVSQYKDAEKKDSWDLQDFFYNKKQGNSDHVDVKLDGAVSLNDSKTAVRSDANYEIIGIYTSEEEAKIQNSKNYGLNWTGEYNGKTRTQSLELKKIANEFSFDSNDDKRIHVPEVWWTYVGVKVSSATFYAKYIGPDGQTKVEKFTITPNDRFKENSWYCGEHSDHLQDVKDSNGKTLETVKIGEKTYYNISGYSVFEISKMVCQDGSGLDLVLSIEVLQSIRDSKDLKELTGLSGSLKAVDITDAADIDLKSLEAALGASGVGLITNDVYNNPYGDPGEKKADPDDLAGLKNVTGAVTPVDISNLVKGKKLDPTALLALGDPTFKPDYKRVDVDPVSGEIKLASPELLSKIDADELKKTDFKPIELKPFGFSFTRGSFVSPFHQLKSLPTRPVTPPGENPPEEPPVTPPTVVPPTVVPPTVTPPVITPPVDDVDVLGAARGSSVLGARRSMAPAVLGKRRRPTTGDSMAMVEWALALSASVGGAAAATAGLKKSKKEEDEE